MRLFRIAGEGVGALVTSKVRTFFMMAGTIVGIAALVVIMAIGKGTEKKVRQRVEKFGPRAIMLIAGGGKDLPPPDTNITTLRLEDAQAIRDQIEGLEIVTPQAWRFNMDLKHGTNQIQSVIWGVEPEWHAAWNWDVAEGDEIANDDVATMARVCVIGSSIKRDLFGDADAVGQTLYVNKVALTVKGVLQRKGTGGMGGMADFDNRMVVPITTAMRRIMNVDYVGAVRIVSRDTDLMPKQLEAIRKLIHDRHHITPPEEDDFRLITSTIIGKIMRGTSRTLSLLLGALAGLSLLVGGVVLMNILLISVAERTKEIGLRRAVGATQQDVFLQFLTESLAVTFLGMLLGMGLGWGIAVVLSKVSSMPVAVSWEPFALAALFALLVGTFFGVQPARRAAKLSPVEALR